MRQPPYGDPGTDPTWAWRTPPRLIVTSKGDLHGRQVPLTGDVLTIGRSEDNHLRLDDPYVSRHHALVRARGNMVLVEDNGSSAGVYVNGRRIDRPTSLQPGDVVRLGRLDLQFLADQAAAPPGPRPAPAVPPTPPAAVQHNVDSQRAGEIYNIGRDYNRNQYYRLEIAPMRRRARILLQLGTALFLAGFGVYGYAVLQGVLNVFGLIGESTGSTTQPDVGGVFEPVIRYTPIGLALLFAGLVLIVTGLLMRRSATAKERRL
jgi:FHA domain